LWPTNPTHVHQVIQKQHFTFQNRSSSDAFQKSLCARCTKVSDSQDFGKNECQYHENIHISFRTDFFQRTELVHSISQPPKYYQPSVHTLSFICLSSTVSELQLVL